MNLRNNKGYTGIDISVAMIIILIFVPTIFGFVYNIQKTKARTERETNAVNIATDVLEVAKSLNYQDISFEDTSDFKNMINNKYTNTDNNSSIDISENGYTYEYFTTTGKNNEHYRIQVGILKYFPENEENTDTEGYVKQVKVIVTYPVGNTTKSINISTIIQNKN